MADGVNNKKPVVRTHEGTGLKYLCGSKQVIFETGAVIDRAEFNSLEKGGLAEKLEIASNEAQSSNFDFAYACSTGFLRRKKSQVTSAVKVPVKEQIEVTATQKQAEQTQEQKKKSARTFVFSSVFLVMAVMIIVGIGSGIMSAYHTSAFLIFGGKPKWTAVLTGVMLILFSGTSFTAARHFMQEKGLQKSFGFLFIVAGFAVISYSIFSTVTVNFNQFKWEDDKKAVIAVEDSEALAAHERLLHENKEALDEVNARISKLEEETDYWKTMSWKRYDEFQTQLFAAQENRAFLRNRRIELESSKPELVAQAESSRETVYTFLARLLGLQEDIARFFVYVIPACLYDILAPFALSVVLLLMDKRRKSIEAQG
jgi:hypothetical protein